jgi:hypothetical protein
MSGDFTKENLALPPELVPPVIARPVPPLISRKRGHFIMVPMEWFKALEASRSGRTYQVALRLLYLRWRDGGPVKLGNRALKSLGVSRQSKWRALAQLQRLGLVRIECRSNKSPLVHLLRLSQI